MTPLATCDGGSVGPNRTSYVVAPSDAHVSVTLAATPAAPLAGDGVFGVAGGAADVVNDQTDPVVDPALLRATICQKYCVLFVSAGGVYDADGWPLTTSGGGFDVPKLTS